MKQEKIKIKNQPSFWYSYVDGAVVIFYPKNKVHEVNQYGSWNKVENRIFNKFRDFKQYERYITNCFKDSNMYFAGYL